MAEPSRPEPPEDASSTGSPPSSQTSATAWRGVSLNPSWPAGSRAVPASQILRCCPAPIAAGAERSAPRPSAAGSLATKSKTTRTGRPTKASPELSPSSKRSPFGSLNGPRAGIPRQRPRATGPATRPTLRPTPLSSGQDEHRLLGANGPLPCTSRDIAQVTYAQGDIPGPERVMADKDRCRSRRPGGEGPHSRSRPHVPPRKVVAQDGRQRHHQRGVRPRRLTGPSAVGLAAKISCPSSDSSAACGERALGWTVRSPSLK
jgi:hypothetical protein